LLCGQSFLGWHLQVFIDMPHCLYKQTLFRFARHDGWPRLSALEQGFPRIEHETAFDLVRLMAVAFIAVLRQDWLDLLFIKLDLLGRKVSAARISAGGSRKSPGCDNHCTKPLAPPGTVEQSRHTSCCWPLH